MSGLEPDDFAETKEQTNPVFQALAMALIVIAWAVGRYGSDDNHVSAETTSPRRAAAVPMIRIPAVINEVHDGDTLSVSFDFAARVRLIDCWAPELKSGEPGKASKANLIKLTSKQQRCMVEIPLHDDLGKSTSLGRILGRVTVIGHDSDLSTQQVEGGFATSKKD